MELLNFQPVLTHRMGLKIAESVSETEHYIYLPFLNTVDYSNQCMGKTEVEP